MPRPASPASLADALFSTTKQRVLSLLYGQPKRRFTVTELLTEAQGGAGAVQREIDRLEQAGLVSSERDGRQRWIQANRASPIYTELSRIVQKLLLHGPMLTEALKPLRNRIDYAFIYGSVAKRSDHAASDIDLMVVGEQIGQGDIYAVIAPVETRLGRPVKPTIYTLDELRQRFTAGQSFIRRVVEQPKEFLIGSEAEFLRALESTHTGQGT
ncbi:MAG: transcriptional regulator [Thermomonas sp.]|uniref:transcriptional regulator n=1 Tax=Thermomonas sp. TaxID=1971895 RepID=UPI0039E4E8FC